MEPVTFTIAVFITLTVATTAVTYMHQMKIKNATKKDLLLNKAQIVIDENGNQTLKLYDESGVELGSDSYNKYIIKGIKKQASILQKEVAKSHKETESLQKQLERAKEELILSKEETNKYKAHFEMDVARSLKSGSSAESSGASLDETDRPTFSVSKYRKLSFSETGMKDVQNWIKRDSKEDFSRKTNKLKASPSHSLSNSLDESGDLLQAIDSRTRSSSTPTKKIFSIFEGNEVDGEYAVSGSRIELDRASFSIPKDALSNVASSNPRVSKDNSILKFIKSSTSPVSARREHRKDPEKNPLENIDSLEVKHSKSAPHPELVRRQAKEFDKHHSDGTSESRQAKINKFKSSSGSEIHSRYKKDLDKSPPEKSKGDLKAKISKLKTSMTVDTHHKLKIDDSKKTLEKFSTVEIKISKLKSSLSPERDVDEKKIEANNSLVITDVRVSKSRTSLSPERIEENQKVEVKNSSDKLEVIVTKLRTSLSPERGSENPNVESKDSIDALKVIAHKFKTSLSPERDPEKLYASDINFVGTAEVDGIAVVKLKSSTSPKLPVRDSSRKLEKPITISLVKSDSEAITKDDLLSTHGDQLKSSGSRSNIYDLIENTPTMGGFNLRNSFAEFSPAVESRMKFIEALIAEAGTPQETLKANSAGNTDHSNDQSDTGISGENSPTCTDHSSETFL